MNNYYKVKLMNYRQFSEFIDGQIIQPIIYDEHIGFEIYEFDGHYFYYECAKEGDSDTFCEISLVAELRYDVNHDIMLKSGEILSNLFDCDVCGEAVFDDCIKYMWFKLNDNIEASIITIWDDGVKVTSNCKYNLVTREIVDETLSDWAIDDFQNLQGIYLIYRATSSDDASWVRMNIIRSSTGEITKIDDIQYFKYYRDALATI